jgi:outer membrane protein assembly factor BamB
LDRLARAAGLLVVLAGLLPAVPNPVLAATPRTLAAAGGSWTVYHHDDAHTGYDPAAPSLGTVGPTAGWTESPLDGQVYGEPLVFNGLVYVATLNNTVYALNQTTGAIVWSHNLGAPQTSGWVCGNVSPQGILGTPVLDTAGGRVYVAAFFAGDDLYHVVGLNLGTGNLELTTVIPNTIGTGFDWRIQQERGALVVANGYVYVPFGGRAGDCFDGSTGYRGWIVGVPTSGSTSLAVYETAGTGAGVWDAGGPVVDDTSHNVFFSTGNAIPCSGATGYSDAVVRTGPGLGSASFFEPQDWQSNWCGPDSDLGSAGPLLLSPSLLFQAGKHGGGFLVDATSLGGVDGQVYPSPSGYLQADVCLGNHSDATFGSFAYAAPYVYLECEGRGLVALGVNTSSRSFTPCGSSCPAPDWQAGSGLTFGPPIVAAGAVWAASDGNGLYAFNAATGAQIFHSGGFGINRFVTPSEAGGQVFVASHTVVKSFTFGGGAVAVSPVRVDFNGQAPGTTSAAQTATLTNNQPASITVTAVSITGVNASQYLKGTDGCSGNTIASGASCNVQVSFHPTGYGGFPATLSFTDSGAGSPQTLALGGLGALDNASHIYTLDGYGGFHADGPSPPLASGAYWGPWNIARGAVLNPDAQGGYLLDGYGGLHTIGNAVPVASAYFGFDIARQVVIAPWSTRASPAGWTLDGYGGIHPFGNAPNASGYAYWPGWDIARGLAILPDSTPSNLAGYTLDGYGGIHPFGGAPAISNNAYWGGWDIARGIALSPDASLANPAGWSVDAYGGVHPFGNGVPYSNFPRWGFDIVRGILTWSGSGGGGWTLDGYGGIHPFGSAPGISPIPYWPGWDIATGLTGATFSTSSRQR